jgi:hypothetical protein
MGMGAWSPDKVSTYNLEDPPMRDTNTVLFDGTTEDKAAWVALRCAPHAACIVPHGFEFAAHLYSCFLNSAAWANGANYKASWSLVVECW